MNGESAYADAAMTTSPLKGESVYGAMTTSPLKGESVCSDVVDVDSDIYLLQVRLTIDMFLA